MNGTNGQACPECEAPRRPDGTPSCGCTRRASEAIRDARTAEAAAAEDFDPLRIRPYVDLGVTTSGAQAAADETMQLAVVPEAAGAAPEGAERPDTALPDASATPAASGAPDETMQLAAVAQDGSRADGTGRPDETVQLGALPAGAGRAEDRPAAPPDAAPARRGRRRRTVVLAAGAAVATVVAAAGLASGLFSYDSPERNGALPEDVRASVPEEASPDSASASTSTASAPVAPASPSPSPSTSTSTSPPASPSTTPSATVSTTASPSVTTGQAFDSPPPTPGDDGDDNPSQESLRHGDKGSDVTELQLRLRQVNLYFGPANGRYGNQVENAVRTYQFMRGITQDEHGVYGPATRAKLESETSRP
ncbi:putative peptidoglycan binding protein [Streptomyces sp. 3212.3]|uniref:peptidoglycan-binding domain-containing protein n=1 Tax=Streptomyces sp. 3212.3 TaxID=1938846 RepID=UPI000E398A97|nr:peptidoglycan-binding domain-containing protein [Streptomyces sp. 3212.3]REE60396.1 putative peptidoglycan binding protein [Streptomyces sp. 3212.3]